MHKQTERAPLQPKSKAASINEQWHIDFCGPIQAGQKKPVYIFGATDACSKYIITGTSTNKRAYFAFRLFLKNVIYKYGVSDMTVSDQGKEYADTVLDKIHNLMRIQRIRASDYHAQSNGQIERV